MPAAIHQNEFVASSLKFTDTNVFGSTNSEWDSVCPYNTATPVAASGLCTFKDWLPLVSMAEESTAAGSSDAVSSDDDCASLGRAGVPSFVPSPEPEASTQSMEEVLAQAHMAAAMAQAQLAALQASMQQPAQAMQQPGAQGSSFAGSWTSQFNPATGTFMPVFVPNPFLAGAAGAPQNVKEEAEVPESSQSKPRARKNKKRQEPVQKQAGFTLFVGGLMPATNSATLREHFRQYGTIRDVNVVLDKVTKQGRGFAFVEFAEDVIDVVLQDEHLIDDRRCGVRSYAAQAK